MSKHDEGHTLAGWIGFGIATVGVVGIGLGVCVDNALGEWGGLAVVAVSVLVTWVLHLAGWGKPPGRRPTSEWGLRVRDLGARQGHPGCVGCRLAGRGRPATRSDVAAGGKPLSGEPVTESIT
ncbi:HGxxPAAW family protein [Streptomyces mirabilis]|uniref:HGxxPAAW family protein n=1 Tax=Streptomyces mirabilis TaxID=68239 RepID=UPI0033D7C6AD